MNMLPSIHELNANKIHPSDRATHKGTELVYVDTLYIRSCEPCFFSKVACGGIPCSTARVWMTPLDAITFRLKS